MLFKLVKLKSFNIIVVFFSISFNSFASDKQMHLGIGKYEGLNLGYSKIYSKYYWQVGLGNDLNFSKQGNASSLFCAIGKEFFKEQNKNKLKPMFQLKTNFWFLENKSNVFVVFTPSLELNFQYQLNLKYYISAYGGLAYSTTLYYKRKTFQDVGYPYFWSANYGISLAYKLN